MSQWVSTHRQNLSLHALTKRKEPRNVYGKSLFLEAFSQKLSSVVVQSLSLVQLFVTSWTAACQAPLSSSVSCSLLRFMSIDSVMLSNHLLLPSLFPSIRVFPNELALCIRWPKYYSFSFSNSHCNEYAGLISFRID